MNPSLIRKLEGLIERHEEVQAMLGEPDVVSDQDRYRALTREYAQLEDIVHAFQRYRQAQDDLDTTQMMLEEEDADLREMAQEELPLAKANLEALEQELQLMLLPKDPKDDNNCYLEIRAGAGGDEAAIFAGDLFRMYSRFAERQGWRVSIVSCNDGEYGGYKEVIAKIDGERVYGRLKFESGGHRVQRVPETESQGRVHTSACTVAVLPEVPEAEQIEINPSDLEDRHLPRLRCRWSARQQDRLGHPHHPPADRAGGGVSGRALPAQEPRQGDVGALRPPASGRG